MHDPKQRVNQADDRGAGARTMHDHNWDEMIKAGIDIARVEILPVFDLGPVYKIRNDDETFVVYGPEYEGEQLRGWTYCSYDDQGGVLANDGGPTFSDIGARVAKFTAQ